MLIIGIGNRDRGDDAAGPAVADRLAARVDAGVEVLVHSGEAASLMDRWSGRETIVVDATHSAQPPGTIQRVDLLAENLAADVLATCSSHAFGLAQAVELARALGEMPPTLVLYGVEGAHFDHGRGLSEVVERSVDEVVEQIIAETTCTK